MGDFRWLAFGISHGYISSSNCADCPHYADDIGTPYHTPVTALFSGTVVSQRTGIAWGSEIFIKPDDTSLPEYYYYHLDILETTAGSHVEAGQTIGLSGGQNSGGTNPTTPEFSSGPHTHVGFFSKWVLTSVGTRPYGPDITPWVSALSSGQSTVGLTTGTNTGIVAAGSVVGGLGQLGEYVVEQMGISQAIVTAISGISPEPFAVIGIATMGIAGALLLAAWFLLNGGL